MSLQRMKILVNWRYRNMVGMATAETKETQLMQLSGNG